MDWREVRALACAFIAAIVAVAIAIAMSVGATWVVSKMEQAPAPSARLYAPEGCR